MTLPKWGNFTNFPSGVSIYWNPSLPIEQFSPIITLLPLVIIHSGGLRNSLTHVMKWYFGVSVSITNTEVVSGGHSVANTTPALLSIQPLVINEIFSLIDSFIFHGDLIICDKS